MNLKKHILSLAFLVITSATFAQDWVDKEVDFFTNQIKTRLVVEEVDNKQLSEAQETKIKAYFKAFVVDKGRKVKYKDIFKDRDLSIKLYETIDLAIEVLDPKQLEAYRASVKPQ